MPYPRAVGVSISTGRMTGEAFAFNGPGEIPPRGDMDTIGSHFQLPSLVELEMETEPDSSREEITG